MTLKSVKYFLVTQEKLRSFIMAHEKRFEKKRRHSLPKATRSGTLDYTSLWEHGAHQALQHQPLHRRHGKGAMAITIALLARRSQHTSSTTTRGRPRVQATPCRVAILGGTARRPGARPLRHRPERRAGGGGRGGGACCCSLHEAQRRVPRTGRRHVVPATASAAAVGVVLRVPAGCRLIGRRECAATRRRRGKMPDGRRRAVGEVLPREERGAVLGDKVVERRAGARGDVRRRRDQPGGGRRAPAGR